MKTTMLTVAMMLSLLGTTGAVAQDATPAKPAEKKVCRAPEVSTGSIMPGKRICHTKSEWAQVDAANQQATDQALQRRAARGSGSAGHR